MEDDEDFAKAEKALMADERLNQVVLGRKSLKRALEPGKEITEEEAYTNAWGSLSKAMKAFTSAVDKLVLLKDTLEAKEKNEPSQQMAASLEALKGLRALHEESKKKYVSNSTLPAGSTEGATLIKQMQSLKEMVDEEQKALCKATNPHRLWAKNAGFL